MRKFQPKINGLSTDGTDFLRCINLFLVALKLCPLSTVVIGTEIWLRHIFHPCNAVSLIPVQAVFGIQSDRASRR